MYLLYIFPINSSLSTHKFINKISVYKNLYVDKELFYEIPRVIKIQKY
jgi:hypothetical protein